MIKKILNVTAWMSARSLSLIKKHWQSIVYYVSVAAVLCAVGYAAEQYRKTPEYVLPAQPVFETAESNKEEKVIFIRPEGMRCIRGYDLAPVWNEVLCQWENHTARDYTLEDNAMVVLCDGEVTAVGGSAHSGNYVEISSGSYVLRYASIKVEDEVQPGKEVRAGEIIGLADASMLSESYMVPHVHLEAFFEDGPIDIEDLLQKNDKTGSDS